LTRVLARCGWLPRHPVYDRYLLGPGATVTGPALVEERESTVLVPPSATGTVDAYRNLIVTTEEQQ
jgi:N-methylhydantoinase A